MQKILIRFPILIAAFMLAGCPLADNSVATPPIVSTESREAPREPEPELIAALPAPDIDIDTETETLPAGLTDADARDLFDGFIGDTARSLEAAMGSPDYRRREGVVEVRQYRADDCVVDFVIDFGAGEVITAWNGRARRAGADFDLGACGDAMQNRSGN